MADGEPPALPVPPTSHVPTAPPTPQPSPIMPPVPLIQPFIPPAQPIQPAHVPQLNWSHFKPEFAGKPDEDAEAHPP